MSKIEEIEPESIEDGMALIRSQVYLGIVDAAIKQSDNISTEDTFIGGEPVWLHPDSVPSQELLRCGACKSQSHMKLLLQAFAPLDPEQVNEIAHKNKLQNIHIENIDSDDERVLYVFACTNCSKKPDSVRCIRGVKKCSNTDALNSKMQGLGTEKDFDINPFDLSQTSTNPFASGPDDTPNANPFAQQGTQPLSAPIKDNKKPVDEVVNAKAARKQHDALPDKRFESGFPGFFLYVEEESFKNKTPDHLKLPKNLKIDKSAFELSADEEEASF